MRGTETSEQVNQDRRGLFARDLLHEGAPRGRVDDVQALREACIPVHHEHEGTPARGRHLETRWHLGVGRDEDGDHRLRLLDLFHLRAERPARHCSGEVLDETQVDGQANRD